MQAKAPFWAADGVPNQHIARRCEVDCGASPTDSYAVAPSRRFPKSNTRSDLGSSLEQGPENRSSARRSPPRSSRTSDRAAPPYNRQIKSTTEHQEPAMGSCLVAAPRLPQGAV